MCTRPQHRRPRVGRSHGEMITDTIRTILTQERVADAWRQLGEVVAELEDAKLDDAAQLLPVPGNAGGRWERPRQ